MIIGRKNQWTHFPLIHISNAINLCSFSSYFGEVAILFFPHYKLNSQNQSLLCFILTPHQQNGFLMVFGVILIFSFFFHCDIRNESIDNECKKRKCNKDGCKTELVKLCEHVHIFL